MAFSPVQRFQRSHHAVALVVAVVVASLTCTLRGEGVFGSLELSTYDHLLKLRNGSLGSPPQVVLVKIGDVDIKQYGYPLTDAQLATLIAKLQSFAPQAIGVDLFRDIASAGREQLAVITARSPRVIMIEGRSGHPNPAPAFLDPTTQVGFADMKQDGDGVVRRGLLMMWSHDNSRKPYLSFPLQLALAYLEPRGVTLNADSHDAQGVSIGEAPIPRLRSDDGAYVADDMGGYQFLLDYRRNPRTYPSFSLSQVMTGNISPAAIRDKVVIVGNADSSIGDRIETPLTHGGNSADYGLEVQAQVVDQLLRLAQGESAPMKTIDHWVNVPIIAVMSFFAALCGLRIRELGRLTFAGVAILMAPVAILVGAFAMNVWLPLWPTLIASVASFGIALVLAVQQQRLERRRIMQLFGQYVSRDVAETLWRQRDEFMEDGRPRPQRLTVTVMMTDLMGYTSAVERMDPIESMSWINSYLDAMTRVVEAHGGFVDDYAGDGMKANFGVPVNRGEPDVRANACRAVDCALAMRDAIVHLNARWQAAQLPAPRMRIGIHTGPVVAGSVGSAQRMSYTTVGDTVNTASRIESWDKERFRDELDEPCRILVSDATHDLLPPDYRVASLGMHALRGRETPVGIWRILGRSDASVHETRGNANENRKNNDAAVVAFDRRRSPQSRD